MPDIMLPLFLLLELLALLPRAAAQCQIGEVACGSICAKPCDGAVECADRSDETAQLCAKHECTAAQTNSEAGDLDSLFNYSQSKFRCAYGGCILETFKCNGSPDCWDGSDETPQQCSSKTCTRRQFRCAYGACIKSVWSCNGNKNCADGSDETEQVCKNKQCRSSQFKCHYGACIDMKEKCDGSADCIDGSDESVKECGPDHTTKPPRVQPPPPSVTVATPKPPIVIQPEIPPTPPTQPGSPGIVFTEIPTPAVDWCKKQGLCACPEPNQHFCVPCQNTPSCSILGGGAVCSIKPAGGPYAQVKVEVLRCGIRPIVSVAGFVRNHEVSDCGSPEGVPAESVVLADCWGTVILAQCHANGTWHTYRGTTASPPSPALCQFQEVNSPVCGQRPRFVRPPGGTIHLTAQPQWPWMVGLKQEGNYFCTATIISPQYLLTAGHCVTRTKETSKQLLDPRDVKVQRVSAEGRIINDRISNIYLHPRYTPGPRPSHDVALVRMEKEIVYSHQVYPACVNTERFPEQEIAATFNRTINEYKWELILQQHDPRCYSPHDRCASSLGIEQQQFCAIDIGSLRYLPEGSSGGPYTVNVGSDVNEHWVVAGVVSSSYRQTSCARPFTIFTSVTEYWPWISKCVHEEVCS